MDTGSFGNRFLYGFGNLHTGTVYGVRLTSAFDSGEIHGPFSSENEANLYADRCANPEYRWSKIEVIALVVSAHGRLYEWQNKPFEERVEVENAQGQKVVMDGNWKLTLR